MVCAPEEDVNKINNILKIYEKLCIKDEEPIASESVLPECEVIVKYLQYIQGETLNNY